MVRYLYHLDQEEKKTFVFLKDSWSVTNENMTEKLIVPKQHEVAHY